MGASVGWRRRRARAAELAAIHAETAQMQINLLRIELTKLHEELARRDIEMVSALSRASTVTDTLRRQLEAEHTTHARLARSIDRLAMFLAAPPLTPATPVIGTADQGAGTIIGGTIDPSRAPRQVETRAVETGEVEHVAVPEPASDAIDLTTDHAEPQIEPAAETVIELPAEVPVAPATRAERPLECEVHLRFGDRWIDGFQIEETIDTGPNIQFRLRRRVDGWVLPELFDESEVRVFMQPVVDPSRT